jgi:hypothetical protein
VLGRTREALALALAIGVFAGPPASASAAVSFTPAGGSPFAVGTAPSELAAGDLNGDGTVDLVVANYSSGNVSVLLGNGSGAFTAAAGSPYAAGDRPNGVAIGNVNAAGGPDILAANYGSDNVTVLLNDGSASFAPAAGSPYAVGSQPSAVVIGNFNAGGAPDLATTNIGSNNVSVLLGNGSGGFAPAAGSPVAVGMGPIAETLGDFNADARPDLAVANRASNNVTVLLGDGNGSFLAAGPPPTVGSSPSAISVADLNGDGRQDLAAANRFSNNVSVLLGNGGGGFAAVIGSPFGVGINPEAVEIGDIDGDGRPDLATANFGSNNFSVLLGNGSAGFTAAAGTPVATTSSPNWLVLRDFNADAKLDFASAIFFGDSVEVRLNTTAPPHSLTAGPVAFGTQALTTVSAPQGVVFSNTSEIGPLRVARVETSGSGADDFLISHDTCTGRSIAVSATCDVHIRFAPSSPGGTSATLVITDDTPGGPATVALTGTGGAPPGAAGAPGGSGPAGGTGPTGDAGPAGAGGTAGTTGSAGTTGATGATGAAGVGTVGESGQTGPQGLAGPSGETGAEGPAGPTSKVKCKVRQIKRAKKRGKRVRVTCRVKTATVARARLTYRGQAIAVRRVRSGTRHVVFHLAHGHLRGSYRLVVTPVG